MKKMTRIIALAMSILMLAVALCGCGGREITSTGVEGKYGKGEISYPIATEGEELEYYVWLAGDVSAHNVTSMNDIDFVKKLNEQTGINVKYINPSSAQWDAQFDLLFTSPDLPDMIQSTWKDFKSGGPDGAIDAGYIADLTDLIPIYAPNFYKKLQANPRALAAATSPKGRLYSIGAFNSSADRGTYGMFLRKDWLDELGLEVPETMDEWYTVLKAFKEKKGATAPYSSSYSDLITSNMFNCAYQVGKMNIKDGKIFYGPATENFVEYIKTMRKWAEEGLIDNNLPTTGTKTFNAKFLNGEAGATTNWLSSGFGTLLRAGKEKDPKFDLVGAPLPVLNKGDRPVNSSRNFSVYSDCVAIAATSPNIELALRYLDYAFTEEGDILNIWGTEGVSYTVDAEGKKQYTDIILNNPNGLSPSQALGFYTRSTWAAPKSDNIEAYLARLSSPQEKATVELWADADDNTLPELTLSAEEKEAYASVMTDIETYISEVVARVVFAGRDIAELENLSAKLYDMGLQKAIDAYQSALDRFNAAMK